jgi:hypothetical protein
MLNRSQIFNYLTLILAVCTILSAILSILNKISPIYGIVLMCIMLIFSHISRKINEEETILTEKQISVLSNVKNKSEEK